MEGLGDAELYALWRDCHAGWAHGLAARSHHGEALTAQALYARLVAPCFGPGGEGSVSLIIPAYCESHRIARSVALVRRFLDEFALDIEVIYVVEASPDDTLALARQAARGHGQIRVHDNGVQLGKGYAVRCGVQMARGDIVFYNDTDLSVPMHQLLYFLAAFVERPELDMLIGRRVRMTNRSVGRRLMSRGFRQAVTALARFPAGWDPQCGFKALRRDAAARVFGMQALQGFAFDVEVLLLARSLGLHIASRQVPWLNDERSTVRPLADLRSVLVELLNLRQAMQQLRPRLPTSMLAPSASQSRSGSG